MDIQTGNRLLTTFTRTRARYQEFERTLDDLVKRVLEPSGVQIHSINCRTKSAASLRRKLMQPMKSYTALEEITDLVGLRIITYFEPDVLNVAEIIESEFVIDRTNSADKAAALDPDRFGYRSMHYVIELPPERTQLTEYRHADGLKAEVQIRSILQHAWAEIEHDLGYKSGESVPAGVRRRFSRVAGLLELADAEFAGIRDELASYEAEMPARLREIPESVPIDKVSLLAFLRSDPEPLALDDEIVKIGAARYLADDPDYVELAVRWVRWLGITDIAALRAVLLSRRALVVSFARAYIRLHHYSFSRGVCLFYLAYALSATNGNVADFLGTFGLAGRDPDAVVARVRSAYEQALASLGEAATPDDSPDAGE